MRLKRHFVLILSILSLCISLQAQVPQKMSIQGILTDDLGEAYPDDIYNLTFRLYTQKEGGVVAWQESQMLESRSGLFNALMGDINPLDIPFNQPYYLGITIDGGDELEPRIEMAAAAYSLIARSITPGGIQLGGLSNNSVDVDNIIPNIVSSINGVTADGSNIQLVAGANITISPDDVNNTITISASDQGSGNSGILQINEGNAIDVNDSDGPTTTISVQNNSINDDEIQNNSISANSLAAGSVGNSEIQDNAVTINKISTDVLTSIDGVSNDGGNVDLIAGANITITPNDVNNSITISAADQGGGNSGILQINPGNAIDVSDIDGPTTTISVDQKSIGSDELQPVVTFENGGIVDIENPNGVRVSTLSYNQFNGGFVGLNNASGIEILRMSNTADNSGSIDISNRFGQPTINLYNWLDKGVISIANANGFESAVMTDDGGFGFIGVAGTNGNGLASMGATDLGDGIFSIYNDQGNLVSQVTEDGFGNGYIGVQNSTEAPIVSMTSNQNGDGLIQLGNQNLAVVAELATSPAGGGQFEIRNVNETVVAEVKEENGAGYVGVLDATETPIAQIHQHNTGIGSIEVMANGIPVAQMTRDLQGNGKVGVFNTLDVPMGGLETEAFGGGFFFLSNPFGNEVVNAQSNQFGGELNLFNDNTAGITTSAFMATGQYGGSLGLQKADGSNSMYFGTNQFDRPNIELFHANGSVATNISSRDLEYFSQNGIQSMILNNPEGFINLNDDAGNTSISLGHFFGTGFGSLTFLNPSINANARFIEMGANINSNAFLDMYYGGTGYIGAYIDILPEGGMLSLFNAQTYDVANMGVTNSGNGIITTKSAIGNELTLMRSVGGGGIFETFNSNGLKSSEMSFSTTGGGYIQLNNANQTAVTILGDNTNEGGYVGVNNPSDVNVGRLTTSSNDNGYFSLSNGSSGNNIVISTQAGDAGGVYTYHTNGSLLTALNSTTSGDGYISLNNISGNERARMTLNNNGGGFISVKDNSGNDRAWLSTSSSDAGVVQTYGPGGTENVRISNSGVVGPDGGAVWIYDNNNVLRASATANGYMAVHGTNGNRNVILGSDPGTPNAGSMEVYDANGNVQAEVYVDGSGLGVVAADIKNFRMTHPNDISKEIWYASLEGPEAGAYTRGTAQLINGEVSIDLPSHFSQVATINGMTVQLTPLSADSEGLAVVEKTTSKITVKELRNGKGNYQFDFIVHAVRKGYDNYEVIREKRESSRIDQPTNETLIGASRKPIAYDKSLKNDTTKSGAPKNVEKRVVRPDVNRIINDPKSSK